jgi:hypothetical protein
MSEEEIRNFFDLVERAKKGTQVNYAETVLNDGSFLGVSVEEQPTYQNHPRATEKRY